MTLMPSIIRAYRFHFKNGGYIDGARSACALRMARAEDAAQHLDWVYEWEEDIDRDLSWMDAAERENEHEVLCVILRSADGEVLASLGGIVDADRDYRRIIEAELALEADAHEVLIARGDEIASGMLAECYA